jgi:hypothetical protein
MQALLLGTQAAAVSAKSAKKGRAMLLNLVLLDGARAAAAAADAADADAAAAADGADADADAAAAAAADADADAVTDANATTSASGYGGAAEAVPSPPPQQHGTAMAGAALAPAAEAAGAAVVATPLTDPRRPRTLALDVLPGGAVRAQLLLSDGAQLARLRVDAGALHGARVSVRARVATLRRRSAGLAFADLTAGGERLQTAVEGDVLCLDSPGQLALRPGSSVRVTGTLGVSRQGLSRLVENRVLVLSVACTVATAPLEPSLPASLTAQGELFRPGAPPWPRRRLEGRRDARLKYVSERPQVEGLFHLPPSRPPRAVRQPHRAALAAHRTRRAGVRDAAGRRRRARRNERRHRTWLLRRRARRGTRGLRRLWRLGVAP